MKYESIEIPKIKCRNEDVKTLFRMAYISSLQPGNDGLCEEEVESFAEMGSLKDLFLHFGHEAMRPFWELFSSLQGLQKKGLQFDDMEDCLNKDDIAFLEGLFCIQIGMEGDTQSMSSAIEALQESLDTEQAEEKDITKVLNILQEMYENRIEG